IVEFAPVITPRTRPVNRNRQVLRRAALQDLGVGQLRAPRRLVGQKIRQRCATHRKRRPDGGERRDKQTAYSLSFTLPLVSRRSVSHPASAYPTSAYPVVSGNHYR